MNYYPVETPLGKLRAPQDADVRLTLKFSNYFLYSL